MHVQRLYRIVYEYAMAWKGEECMVYTPFIEFAFLDCPTIFNHALSNWLDSEIISATRRALYDEAVITATGGFIE